uniref:TSA: Wollemia nobilis Ref_Wollemi_Transcript_21708_876 transcribed RNA sequence n=1 Tax=Wollemia nobilis TaxID=56998 RepID=A0A0C9RR54_9CONI
MAMIVAGKAMAVASMPALARTPTLAAVHPPRLGMPGTPLAGNSVSTSRLPSLKTGSLKFLPLQIKATSSSEETSTSSIQTEDLLNDLKEKWDAVENKPTVLLYGGGAVVAVWLASIIVSAINSVPLLPKLMELIGLGYTGWFIYRYLLFKSSRKELASDIEEIKKKITGATE